MESTRSETAVDTLRARPRLSAEGLAVLQTALEKEAGGRSPRSSSALRHAMWRICIDARRTDWRPEWLLVAFKAGVNALPAVQRVARGPDRDELVADLVSLCIEEYYRIAPLGDQEYSDRRHYDDRGPAPADAHST